MGKTRHCLTGTKTVELFITKKGGTKREEVIDCLIEWVNMTEEDADTSIQRAINLGEIIEKNGKLYCIDPDTGKIER